MFRCVFNMTPAEMRALTVTDLAEYREFADNYIRLLAGGNREV